MWYERPDVAQDTQDWTDLWKKAVQCIYIEILAKSLVEAYPEYGPKYWEYAERIARQSLDRGRDVVLGRYLSRHDDDLMERLVRLKMHDVAI